MNNRFGKVRVNNGSISGVGTVFGALFYDYFASIGNKYRVKLYKLKKYSLLFYEICCMRSEIENIS